MADLKVLSVQKRNTSGKGFNRRLRQGDIIPGIFYSGHGENISVQMAAPVLNKLYNEVGRTKVFQLEIDHDGQKTTSPVLIWDVQRHPIKNRITHIDFYGVELDKPVKVTVPIDFVGTAKGTKVGGVLLTYREYVRLIAKPLDMPPRVVVDVTNMDLGKTIRVSELQLPEGVKASYDVNFAIAAVLLPGSDLEEEESTEAAATDATAPSTTPATPQA